MESFADYGIDVPDSGVGQYRTICPWCEPTRKHKGNKDLSVDLEKGLWNCHHCGETGCLKTGRDKKQDQVKSYQRSQPLNETTPENDQQVQAKAPPFKEPILRALSVQAVDFLKGRGISEETAMSAAVRSASVHSHKLGKETEAIAFPVVKDGKVVNL